MNYSGYTHSNTFGALKNIADSKHHLSSYQYLSTLDTFLSKALDATVTETRFVAGKPIRLLNITFQELIWAYAAWGAINVRRKTTMSDRSDVANTLCNMMIHTINGPTVEDVMKVSFDRLFLSTALEQTLAILEPKVNKTQVEEIAAKNGRFWLNRYYEWREVIIMKYIRHVLNCAQRDYTQFFCHRVPLDDIVNVYLLALHRSIDKCSSDLGVLTTHVGNYMKTARAIVSKRMDSLNTKSIDDNENYVNVESQNPLNELEIKSNMKDFQNIADFVKEGLWGEIADSFGISKPYYM